MTTGAGIAIAGIWLFSGLVCISKYTSGAFSVISALIALLVTYLIK